MAHSVSTALRVTSLVLAQVCVVGLASIGCTTEVVGDDEEEQAAECTEFTGAGCEPGESRVCDGINNDPLGNPIQGTRECELVDDEGCGTEWGACITPNTPLVLSFDNAPVELIAGDAHTFDINGEASMITDWPSSATPWLAIDLNGNGQIEDGSELFGSMSVLKTGGRAANGFIALRDLDSDGDGRITPADEGFARLLIWSDRDGDRVSSQGELAPAGARSLVSIDLDYISDPRCDARGNCEVERAAFRYLDASGAERTGTVIDVHFMPQR